LHQSVDAAGWITEGFQSALHKPVAVILAKQVLSQEFNPTVSQN